MRNIRKCAALIMVLLLVCLMMTGCHGSRDLKGFSIPSEFDMTRDYEITFWAKNDTNKTQTDIYKQAIADFNEL